MLKINHAANEIIRSLEVSGLTTREAIEAIGLSLTCMIHETVKSNERDHRLADLFQRISFTFKDNKQKS